MVLLSDNVIASKDGKEVEKNKEDAYDEYDRGEWLGHRYKAHGPYDDTDDDDNDEY